MSNDLTENGRNTRGDGLPNMPKNPGLDRNIGGEETAFENSDSLNPFFLKIPGAENNKLSDETVMEDHSMENTVYEGSGLSYFGMEDSPTEMTSENGSKFDNTNSGEEPSNSFFEDALSEDKKDGNDAFVSKQGESIPLNIPPIKEEEEKIESTYADPPMPDSDDNSQKPKPKINVKTIVAVAGVILVALVGAYFLFHQPKKVMTYEDYMSQGKQYLSEEKYEAAEDSFTKASELEPKKEEPYEYMYYSAEEQQNEKKKEQAVKQYENNTDNTWSDTHYQDIKTNINTTLEELNNTTEDGGSGGNQSTDGEDPGEVTTGGVTDEGGTQEIPTNGKVTAYQITFDGNGGTDIPETVKTNEKGVVKIPTKQPAKENNTFKGWTTKKDGKEAEYQPGQEITVTSDTKLYAVWEAKSAVYKLTFDAAGGNGGPEALEADSNGKATIPTEQPTKENNTFKGWTSKKDGKEAEYQPGQEITVTSDTKLYAVWEAKPVIYKLTFNASGGSGGPEALEADSSGNVTIPNEAPTKEKNNFKGWTSKKDGKEVEYTSGQAITLTKDTELYAVWEEVVIYKLTFNVAGGSDGPEVLEADSSGNVTIPSEQPTKEKYIFKGWASKKDGKEVEYTPGQAITLTKDTELYAVWEEVVIYKLTFNVAGGSDGPEALEADSSGNVTIPSEQPTKEKYIFKGWASKKDGKEVEYTPGQAITLAKDTELYAVWEPEPVIYKLTFNTAGGSGGPAALEADAKGNVTIPTEQPTKEKNNFKGWTSKKDGKEAEYSPGETMTLTKDTELYAVWEEYVIYNLTFNTAGGSGGPGSLEADAKGNVTIPTEQPTKEKNNFKGWTSKKDGKEAEYSPGETMTLTKDTELYAVWEEYVIYELTFNTVGGSGAPETVETDYRGNVTIPMNEPTKDKSTFLGWSTSADAQFEEYYPGQTITLTGDLNLYAVWEEEPVVEYPIDVTVPELFDEVYESYVLWDGSDWATEVYFYSDGTVEGYYYYDTNDSGEDYDMTRYVSYFSAKIKNIKKTDEGVFTAELTEYRNENPASGEAIIEEDSVKVRVIFEDKARGFENCRSLTFYGPQTPVTQFTDHERNYLPDPNMNSEYGWLLNNEDDCLMQGFIPE